MCAASACAANFRASRLRDRPRFQDGALLGRGWEKTVTADTMLGLPVARMSPRTGQSTLQKERRVLLLLLGRPHLLQMIGSAFDASSREAELIVEIASFGSMLDLADSLEFEGELHLLTERHVDSAADQVEEGLEQMRQVGLEHGDLRPQNVLVFEFSEHEILVKLGDFGQARAHRGADRPAALRAALHELVPGKGGGS
jgi:serine/threonine protein kinase